ncbi:MAG: hypothetical protein J7M25_00200 [Deltaproteobacteria bacterium]|nr:hypothetical protein [Deltaproteobacteria bacterium]
MRKKIRQQLPMVEPAIDHEHSKELAQIRKVLAEHPEIGDMVYADLVRGLEDPEAGREGMMTAEQMAKTRESKLTSISRPCFLRDKRVYTVKKNSAHSTYAFNITRLHGLSRLLLAAEIRHRVLARSTEWRRG